jgi:pyruvate dehydrogenase (quinone)
VGNAGFGGSAPVLRHRGRVVVDRYALSLPSHVPLETVKGFTLSFAKQALSGKMDDIIETVERNVRLL